MPIEWLGIGFSLLGTLFLVTHGSLDMLLSISFNRGDLLFFACQQGWAIYSLIGVRGMARMSALTATAWAGFFGVCWTVLYGLVAGQLYVVPASATCWLSLGYVTLLGGIFAMLAWNVSLRAVGAGKAAIFLNLMPLVGVSAGVLLLDEDFVWQQCFRRGRPCWRASTSSRTAISSCATPTGGSWRRARAIRTGPKPPRPEASLALVAALRTRAGLAISCRHARTALLLSGWPSPGDGSCSPQQKVAGRLTR